MNYTIFLNGERGLFILKKLLKKQFNLNHAVYCNKRLKKKLLKLIPINKIIFLKNINSSQSEKFLNKNKSNLFIIAGYPQIFKEKIFNIPSLLTLNLHGGPLPKYRGGSPLNWQIINGEKKIGISIIKVNKKIDGGKIIDQQFFKLKNFYDIKIVHEKANKLFFSMLFKLMNKLNKKKFKISFLKKKGVSKYWHQRDDNDGFLDYQKKTALECYNFIRATTFPYPGAWIKYKILGKIYKIRLVKSKITNKISNNRYKTLKYNSMFLKCKNKVLKITKFKYDND